VDGRRRGRHRTPDPLLSPATSKTPDQLGTRNVAEPPELLHRTYYATVDIERARDLIDVLFGLDVTPMRHNGLPTDLSICTGRDLAVAQVTTSFDTLFANHGSDVLMISTLRAGTTQIERGKTSERYSVGDIYLVSQPRTRTVGMSIEAAAHTVTLPTSLLARLAGDGRDDAAGRYPRSGTPVAGGAERWRSATRYVDDLLADPVAGTSPLLIGSAVRLLGSVALAVFPATTWSGPGRADSRDARATTVARAVEFIEAHPHLDITVSDIAQAAFATPRAVQLAFRRHLDTTPMAYLRRVRLDRAHDDLRNATPGDGQTVAAIAARWGFRSPSTFATRYRAAFGRSPSDTLRD
jgi:AraC-like DNA-binding protein